jgi:hypothetical protein
MSGWIKLHRVVMEWGWYSDPVCRSLFIHLLLLANHDEREWLGFNVMPGQTPTGRRELALTLGFGEQQVRTALGRLKSTNEITITSNSKFSMITINKWEDYQSTNHQSNQQLTSIQPASNQHLTTPKEVKKIRSKESIDTELLKMPFKDFPLEWKDWALEKTTLEGSRLEDTWLDFKEYWVDGKGRNTKRGDWSRSWRKWCEKYLKESNTKKNKSIYDGVKL